MTYPIEHLHAPVGHQLGEALCPRPVATPRIIAVGDPHRLQHIAEGDAWTGPRHAQIRTDSRPFGQPNGAGPLRKSGPCTCADRRDEERFGDSRRWLLDSDQGRRTLDTFDPAHRRLVERQRSHQIGSLGRRTQRDHRTETVADQNAPPAGGNRDRVGHMPGEILARTEPERARIPASVERDDVERLEAPHRAPEACCAIHHTVNAHDEWLVESPTIGAVDGKPTGDHGTRMIRSTSVSRASPVIPASAPMRSPERTSPASRASVTALLTRNS